VRLFDPYARLVEVVVDRGEGFTPRWEHGTGCVVAGRTVLTAAHVVSGAVTVRVRLVDKSERPATLDAAFAGDGRPWQKDGSVGPDLALLTIDDETIDLPPLGLAKIDHDQPGPLRDVRTVGFPWFAERITSGEVRVAADVYGDVALASGATTGLPVLQVEHPPSDRDEAGGGKSAWSGISGAPVLVANRLLGVVCEHLPRQGTVTFVPLTALHHDPERPLWGPGVADPQAWWNLLGAPRGLRNLVALPPAREAPYQARLREMERALRARMPRLEGRERELQDLEEFATGPVGYRWLEGGAFTGKTALLLTAVTAGLGDDVDVVSYFLSRRSADADANHFLSAVVPQLEVLCRVDSETGARDRNRFLQLWEQAVRQAEADQRHLLLLVDGLDEERLVRGSPSVAQLLPTMLSSNAHVHVSARPHTQATTGLPDSHPMLTCTTVKLAPFPGAAELAELAKAEIDELIAADDDGFSADVYGLLAAAAGPLSRDDLIHLHTPVNRTATPQQLRHRIKGLVAKTARSLEPVDRAEQPRYRFAHETLLAHAQALPDHDDYREYRERIDVWAEYWREQGWPSSDGEAGGTPLYLLDSYPAVLADDPALPTSPDLAERLAALTGDVRWLAAAIPVVGVDLVVAWMHTAAPLVANNLDVARPQAVVAAQAVHLRPPSPLRQPGFVLRQLCLQAMIYGWHDLADTIRDHLQKHQPAGLIPQWTTLAHRPPSAELGRHDRNVRAIAVLKDRRVISGGEDGRVRLWDLHASQHGPRELGCHEGWVGAAAVLSDGRVVTGGEGGRVMLWDPLTPNGRPEELGQHEASVWALAALQDGRVVSGGVDGRLLLWDSRTPERCPLELGSHRGWVWAAGELTDGRIVTGGGDGRVLLWDPGMPGREPEELGRHDGWVGTVLVLGNGRVISGGEDRRVRIWDPNSLNAEPVDLGRQDGRVWAAALLDDGRVVTGGDDGRVLLWAPHAPGTAPEELGRHEGWVGAVGVLDDGRVVSGGEDGRVRLWDSRADVSSNEPLAPDGSVMREVAVFDDGRVVTGGDDGRVRLWDPRAINEDPVELGRHDGRVKAVAVLDNRQVMTWSDNWDLWLWDTNTPGVPSQEPNGVTDNDPAPEQALAHLTTRPAGLVWVPGPWAACRGPWGGAARPARALTRRLPR
jgi:WD40 repeat protein